jgi:undecaprenyl-diphosphatase
VALVAFVIDSFLVANGSLLTAFDIPVEHAVQGIPWGPIGTLMTLTNNSGGWGQVILGASAVVGLFFYERRAGWLMALGAIGSVLDSVFKSSFARHRPTADLVTVLHDSAGYSYPSGHAVFFTWLAFMLAVVFAPRLRPSRRALVWVPALLLIVVACLGRVWAGAHWPSDVIGGFLLGLSWSAFVLFLPERWLPSPSWTWFRRGRARNPG